MTVRFKDPVTGETTGVATLGSGGPFPAIVKAIPVVGPVLAVADALQRKPPPPSPAALLEADKKKPTPGFRSAPTGA